VPITDNAMRLLEAKQYDQGIALLLRVTQKAPNAAAAYVDLGMAYGKSGAFASGGELTFPAIDDAESWRHELAGESTARLRLTSASSRSAGLAVGHSEVDVGRGGIRCFLGDSKQQRDSLIVLLRLQKAHRVVVIGTNVAGMRSFSVSWKPPASG